MNIFALHSSPELAAQYHCDKHCVKMIIEYAQLLSTAHRILDGTEYVEKTKNNRSIKRWFLDDSRETYLYKASHINHPSAIWARKNVSNYNWLYSLFSHLCDEYSHRYGKTHLTDIKLRRFLSYVPNKIDDSEEMTEIPQAMPQHCKMDNYIEGYRNYYKLEKRSFCKWTNRETPKWFTENAIL